MNSGTAEFEFVTVPDDFDGQYSAPFNMAKDEYLLERCSTNFILFWRNRSAVIVGVNQNTLSEVDLEYTSEKDIEVVRRMSGGGAVYHDMGNICYTLVAPYDITVNTYHTLSAPIIEYLSTLGIKAEFSGRNDILVDGYKISGNAQRVKGGRVMHHGTILFDTDLTVLGKALKPSPLKLESKGIKSVRSRVKNIRELCKKDMTTDEFYQGLCDYFKGKYPEKKLSASELEEISEIAREKYSTYEWNVGKSPVSEFSKSYKFPYGIVELGFDIVGGVIKNVTIHGDFFEIESVSVLVEKLDGVVPVKSELRKALQDIDKIIKGAEPEEFIEKLFFSGENV